MQERISLPKMLAVLAGRKKTILACTVGAALVSAAVSLVLPQWFKARASILPPESGVEQSDILSIMRFAGYRPAYIPTLTSPSEIYSAILRSRRITDAVIDSLDLTTVYKGSRMDARDRMWERTHISVTGEGLVLVDFEDRDRARAAAVANVYVRELERFYSETRLATARRVRQLIEQRLAGTSAELDGAENDLRDFKQATGVAVIGDQAKASIETAAELYGKIAEMGVALERMRQYATDKSPEVIDIKSQIRALERTLADMGYAGAGGASDQTGGVRVFPRFDAAPALEKQLAGLVTAVEIKRSVYRVLSEQYEEARIQEMKNTSTIQVLDWAQPPDVRSKPKRKLIVGVSTAAALLLSSFWVLYRDRSYKMLVPDEPAC
jgi:tyrosine-protein kinase Etk/Wzc